MGTVLVTGANRGLGLEFVRQYALNGMDVIATCRNPDEADDLNRLAAEKSGITVETLDVTDFVRAKYLADKYSGTAIDILVCNAGVLTTAGPRTDAPLQTFGDTDFREWDLLFRVNVLGVMSVVEAFAEHVARSELKRIAAVSSRMGSIGDNTSGGRYAYRSTKTALNAVARSLSIDLAPKGILISVLHPGWAQTRMGGPSALTPATESVAGMRRVIADLTPETSGQFRNFEGELLPW